MCGISFRHNFIFLRNHKCGSTSCQQILENYIDIVASKQKDTFENNKLVVNKIPWIHATSDVWKQYLNYLDIKKNIPMITTVRNPWDRMVSLYHYKGWHSKFYGKNGFNSFIKNIFKDNMYEFSTFIFDKDGNRKIEHVIRLENFNKDMKILFKKFGINLTDKELNIKVNKSSRNRKKSYKEFYNDETKNIVANAFKYEIIEFGYIF